MQTVDTAPPSSPLELKDSKPVLFLTRDQGNVPSVVTVPGSSNFDLALFAVAAIGTVKAAVPGTLTLTLYGTGKGELDETNTDPATWLPLASAPAEPIGGATDLPETMWMIQGCDLMIFSGSGKMQGLFKSNVASNPQGPIDLTQHPGDITPTDPLYVFAVGAAFTPGAESSKTRAIEPVLCTVTLESFTMGA